jgi:predicted phosphodiesterase
MRYLILSDIHANYEAFRAVMNATRRKRWDKAVCLGDIVGYAAEVNQTVDRLRAIKPLVVIRGNHDKVCSGVEGAERLAKFSKFARIAAEWTARKLTRGNRRYLSSLSQGPRVVDGAFAIAHGSPLDEDAYIFSDLDALRVFRSTDFPICFVGHSHFPVVFSWDGVEVETQIATPPEFKLRLDPKKRYLINPGSVGQPRDRCPLSSFATYNSENRLLGIHRVRYDIGATQENIMSAGLPAPLAERLSVGR